MKIFLVYLGIILISLTSAQGIGFCIDHTPPSAPSNLILTASGNNIQLTWTHATDTPACSGIDFYDIYRGKNQGNLSFINYSKDTNYLDEDLAWGTYTYMIHAWDLAGHNEGNGVSNNITIYYHSGDDGNGGGSSGGGGSYSSYWECGEWGECIGGFQTRTCVDLKKLSQDKEEIRVCSLDFLSLDYDGDSEKELELNPETTSYQSFLTGAVTGVTNFAKTGKGAITFIILIGAIGGLIIVRRYKLKKNLKF